MYESQPGVVVKRPSALMWVNEIALILGTLAALALAVVMLLSDDLGDSLLADADSSLGRLLSTIPAPGPALLLLALGLYGAAKSASGIRLLIGTHPLLFVIHDVQGVAIGAKPVAGPERTLAVARGGAAVLSARRVTRVRGAFVRSTMVRVDTDEAFLEVETRIPAERLDSSPLRVALEFYTIRFEDRIAR
jgi:hypothetical protein